MLDYAGMKYLYAGEIAGFFRSAGKNPSRSDISFLLRQTCVADHGRIADLLDAITTMREKYRSAWGDQYADYRLGVELGRWQLEYEYWAHFQMRLEDLFSTFKNGDTLPSLEELRPHP
jgi:hexosaminidase